MRAVLCCGNKVYLMNYINEKHMPLITRSHPRQRLMTLPKKHDLAFFYNSKGTFAPPSKTQVSTLSVQASLLLIVLYK